MKLGSCPSACQPLFLGVGMAATGRALVTHCWLLGILYPVSVKCHKPPSWTLGADPKVCGQATC
jgi:hypothetical protein